MCDRLLLALEHAQAEMQPFRVKLSELIVQIREWILICSGHGIVKPESIDSFFAGTSRKSDSADPDYNGSGVLVRLFTTRHFFERSQPLLDALERIAGGFECGGQVRDM